MSDSTNDNNDISNNNINSQTFPGSLSRSSSSPQEFDPMLRRSSTSPSSVLSNVAGSLNGSERNLIRQGSSSSGIGGGNVNAQHDDVMSMISAFSFADFDPRRWVVAAGELEKRRDGKMRQGWANRFFVLTNTALFYFRLPDVDKKKEPTSLLGEERGSIKLTDVQSVHCVPGDEGPNGLHYLHFSFSNGIVKKPFGLSSLGPSVEMMVLRGKKQTCLAWEVALMAMLHGNHNRAAASFLAMSGSSTALPTDPQSDDSGVDDVMSPCSLPSSVPGSPPSRNTSINYARSNTSAATIAAVEKLCRVPKPYVPETAHLNYGLAVTVLVGANALWMASDTANDFVVWLVFNALLIGACVLLESRAIGHDEVLRSVQDYVDNIETACAILKKTTISEGMNIDMASPIGRSNFGSGLPPLGLPSPGVSPAQSASPSPSGGASLGVPGGSMMSSLPSMTKLEAGKVMHAGESSVRTAPPEEEDCLAGKVIWGNGEGEKFSTRIGPNYSSNKKKDYSGPSMYDCVNFDLIKSSNGKVYHCATKIQLPPPRESDDLDAISRSGLPRIIVVNMVQPMKAPSLFGGNKDDASDPGVSCIFYFAVKPETVKQALLEDTDAPAAIKLLKRFVSEWSTNNDIRRRFKGIAMADNLDEIPVAKMFSKYNGKPIIINKSGDIYEGQGYLEIDVKVQQFAYPCKAAMHSMRHKARDLQVTGGFLVQGEDDEDELPEVMLGCFTLLNLDFTRAHLVADL